MGIKKKEQGRRGERKEEKGKGDEAPQLKFLATPLERTADVDGVRLHHGVF